jgi:hypothetical protein
MTEPKVIFMFTKHLLHACISQRDTTTHVPTQHCCLCLCLSLVWQAKQGTRRVLQGNSAARCAKDSDGATPGACKVSSAGAGGAGGHSTLWQAAAWQPNNAGSHLRKGCGKCIRFRCQYMLTRTIGLLADWKSQAPARAQAAAASRCCRSSCTLAHKHSKHRDAFSHMQRYIRISKLHVMRWHRGAVR